MFYRLKDKYLLRGWDKLPYAIVDSTTGDARFLTPEQMQAMELCAGTVDISMPFIPSDIKHEIANAFNDGLIEECHEGEGLKANQEYKKYPSRYIRSVQWSVTGKCNYRCKHCYMSAPDVHAKELSHEDAMKIIDQLAECGVMSIHITGGEPLIRDDFPEILDALTERGIIIKQICSNGALVNKKFLTELEKRNLHPSFTMSYDGTDGWHDWLRGVNGAEVLVNRAFELCRDMGFRTSANMTLHSGNLYTLRDTVKHIAKLGAGQIKTAFASDMGEWKTKGKKVSLKDVFQTYLDYLPYYYGEDGMPIKIFFTSFFIADPSKPDEYEIIGYHDEYDPDETLLCGNARSNSYISPDGRPLMCGLMAGIKAQEDYPTMLEKKFSDCISTPEYMKLIDMRASDFLKINTKCRTCEFTKHCYGGCRGVALMENENDLMGTSETVCEMYKGGWIKKIVETVKKARPTAICPVKDESLL